MTQNEIIAIYADIEDALTEEQIATWDYAVSVYGYNVEAMDNWAFYWFGVDYDGAWKEMVDMC